MPGKIKSSVQKTPDLAIANVSGMLLGAGGSSGKLVRQVNIDVEETDEGYVAVLTYELEEAEAKGDDDIRNPKRRPEGPHKAEHIEPNPKPRQIYHEHLAVKAMKQAKALRAAMPVVARGPAFSYALRPAAVLPFRSKPLPSEDHPAADLLWEKQYSEELVAQALSEELKRDFVIAELEPEIASKPIPVSAEPTAPKPRPSPHAEGEDGPAPEPA